MHFKNTCLVFLFFSNIFLSAQTKPNIIYLMADDLGYADLSCYGRKDYQTPNLDKLAAQGVRFMNAYAAAPVCTPTRVAFFTGRYPAHIPVGLHEPLDWIKKDSSVGLDSSYTTLPSLLKKSGYETFLVGKWHLGFKPEHSPLRNGFDYFFGFHGGAIDYISHTDPQGHNDLYENDRPQTINGYMTDLLMQKSVEIIRRDHKKPFFLCITFNAPHWPWQGPNDSAYAHGMENWTKGGSATRYSEMMNSLDNAVGQIMSALDGSNFASNTVVIFTSDNGGERFSDNGIYKGGKMSLWEGGIREPAFVRWPGKIREKSVTNQVVTTMDWTATILSLANGKVDPKLHLDGIDVMPMITGRQKEVNRTVFWRISQRKQNKAVRDGNWKYLQDEKGNEYIFDLVKDPKEENNLKDQHHDIFEKLKTKYADWEQTVLPPVPLGN